MVFYEYDGNAFKVMETKLTSRGLQPEIMRLDNEGWQLLK
jgi:hypothetical protein